MSMSITSVVICLSVSFNFWRNKFKTYFVFVTEEEISSKLKLRISNAKVSEFSFELLIKFLDDFSFFEGEETRSEGRQKVCISIYGRVHVCKYFEDRKFTKAQHAH